MIHLALWMAVLLWFQPCQRVLLCPAPSLLAEAFIQKIGATQHYGSKLRELGICGAC